MTPLPPPSPPPAPFAATSPSLAPNRANLAYLAMGMVIVAGAILGYGVLGGSSSTSVLRVTTPPRPTPAPVEVQVSGQVNAPGVISVPATARVQDAIDAAGGTTASADPSVLNLAARVTDGQRIVVPRAGDSSAAAQPASAARATSNASAAARPTTVAVDNGVVTVAAQPTTAPRASSATAPASASRAKLTVAEADSGQRLNLNTASLQQLETLPGVGATSAQKILDYRQQTPFTSIQQLLDARLVNASTFARIQDLVGVN